MSNSFKLYAVRDTKTGKLVNDLSNPKRKYWDRKSNCEKAIERAYPWYKPRLELVELIVTEVPKESEVCLDG